MKNRQVIGLLLLMCFLLVTPLHSAKAGAELDPIIQQITMKQYEEGVNQLNDWYITLNMEFQTALHREYSLLITTLSSTEVTHSQKIMSTWSFMSLAEYLTTDNVTYIRFLVAEFNQEWSMHDNAISHDLQVLNGLYSAMIPTLQLMVDQRDTSTLFSLTSSEGSPVIVKEASGLLPSFEEWYLEQSTHSTLLIVSLITGTIVVATLIYVSWRKYEGERNRKRIRNHND